MRCLVTCGPTFEELDQVRRLTNFSTGKLGVGLANHLVRAGHEVTLLKGYYAICRDDCTVEPITFSTTEDLLARIQVESRQRFDAVFHAAAVSDFRFGGVFRRAPHGKLEPVSSGKFKTSDGILLAELVPTPKIINRLRELFPSAKIFGWKYEVTGTSEEALAAGRRQVLENETNHCVVNGSAYGPGFGIVSREGEPWHCPDAASLYLALSDLLSR
jgi:phosphopantothenoylcysteine synthetase/decarboxylase